MQDSEIVRLYQNRDEAAIGETAAKYAPYLTQIAGHMDIFWMIREIRRNVSTKPISGLGILFHPMPPKA